jgi:hypothetical protein
MYFFANHAAKMQSHALGLKRPLRAESWVYFTMIVPFMIG